MRERFQKAAEDIYLLKSPLGNIWSGIVFVDGEEKILIDSGDNAAVIDEVLVPALADMGDTLSDMDWLCNTHCHGDHVGGNYRIKELSDDIKVAAYETAAPKVQDPLKYSKQIRAVYPSYSPAPPPVLAGVTPDLILKDQDMLGGRLQVIATPGHDTECVCFYDTKTKTLITGDSLQGNGTCTQGLALYMDYAAYKNSIDRLRKMDVEILLSGHPYLYSTDAAFGKEEVKIYLDRCEEITEIYGTYIKEQLQQGITDSVIIAEGLIQHMKNQRPNYLFLPLYTVDAHRKVLE